MKKIVASILAIVFTISGLLINCYASTYREDINHDGEVNSSDALEILLYSVGQIDEISPNADINNDGAINSSDALEVLCISVGLKDKTEIEETHDSCYKIVNNNIPNFTEEEKKDTSAFERYSDLDSLGRCGIAYANICIDIMPTEPRGEIGSIKPTGWHTIRYDDIIDGKYLYNRCHLIGYQLAGENANEKNLITGTRYLNVQGMLPFENMVDDYVDETHNHVLYRVTPDFVGNELVARGVQIEAYSVEDNGEGICFNVYCYNIQPGIEIDYLTGESKVSDRNITDPEIVDPPEVVGPEDDIITIVYVTKTGKKYHKTGCRYIDGKDNLEKLTVSEADARGLTKCEICFE